MGILSCNIFVSASLLVAVASAPPAQADEGLHVIEASGDWIAMVHQTSSIAAPDMCGASAHPGGLILRVDDETTEIRVSDESWSLPARVTGDIALNIGNWKKAFNVSSNEASMVIAVIEKADMEELLGEMDKAGNMTVTVGKSKPKQVSLAGSTKVTNAFRRCAGLNGNAASGGANPFQ